MLSYDKNNFSIYNTGGEDDSFLFRHLILTEEQLKEIEDNEIELRKLAEELSVDFISVKRRGEVEFFHTTSIDNWDSIKEKGLRINEEKTYVSDLGNGLYCVQIDNDEALENVKNYVYGLYDDKEEYLIIIEGTYIGQYTECLYGWKHEGYIVLLFDEKIKITSMYDEMVKKFSGDEDDFEF